MVKAELKTLLKKLFLPSLVAEEWEMKYFNY